ncbi:hypothetical protein ACOBR2_19905 [Telmatobacter bradus]|uniref:hypothetical protein n=1 Tax=Telmatobacter bradus TaxID=474953 RepID=UPI003B4327DF
MATQIARIGKTTAVDSGYDAWAHAEIEAGLADAELGRTIPHEKVVAWLNSWGTENELPPPQ